MPTRSRKARLTLLLTYSLALGVLTTIGLAWGSALLLDFENTPTDHQGKGLSSAEWWHLSRSDVFGGMRYTSTVMIRMLQYEETDDSITLPSWVRLPEPPTLGRPFRNEHYEIVEARGWPWPALSYLFMGRGRAQARTGDVTGGFELQPWSNAAWYSPRVLPYTPIWPGLLGNLLILSLAWFIVLAGISECRRAWRRRRSRCEECAYPVGASHACTECGHSMR